LLLLLVFKPFFVKIQVTMDIEQLTKTQIVLLTLLISFVTSIATGIVTVTLLDQAPPAITQTINRVVERTIERIVPDKSQNASVVTKEITVVVREDDLITESIRKNANSLVRITVKGAESVEENSTETFVGLGFIITSDGIIATDSSLIVPNLVYTITTSEGVFEATVLRQHESSSVALLGVRNNDDEKKEGSDEEKEEKEEHDSTISYQPVVLSDLRVLKLGQSVIALSGKERTSVAIGIISDLFETDVVVPAVSEETKEKDENVTTVTVLSAIETSIAERNVLSGSPLIDIFGEVVGISTGRIGGGNAVYTPASVITSELAALATVETAAELEELPVE